MNTATGTIQDKLSDDDATDRRRGMKLVPCNRGSKPFRIAMSQDLANSFLDSENTSVSPKPIPAGVGRENGELIKENASPGEGIANISSVTIAVTLAAAAVTGVAVGYLLRRRGRD